MGASPAAAAGPGIEAAIGKIVNSQAMPLMLGTGLGAMAGGPQGAAMGAMMGSGNPGLQSIAPFMGMMGGGQQQPLQPQPMPQRPPQPPMQMGTPMQPPPPVPGPHMNPLAQRMMGLM